MALNHVVFVRRRTLYGDGMDDRERNDEGVPGSRVIAGVYQKQFL